MFKNILKGIAVCTILGTGIVLLKEDAYAMNITTEAPGAGMSIALSNYYEATQTPQENIIQFLSPEIKEKSLYTNLAVAKVTSYVNVRKEPNTSSEIIGKVYNNCAANIVETTGEWYKIKSGTLEGYIKSEYFATGEEAETLALQSKHVVAKVTCSVLNVRESQSVDSKILTTIPLGESYDVIEYGKNWVYLNIDGDINGWVSMDYVEISTNYQSAISIEEEKAAAAEAAAAKKAAQEAAAAAKKAEAAKKAAAAAKKAEAAKKAAANKTQNTSSASNNSSNTTIDTSSATALQKAVVAYALQFVGNPYKYGGNSLTNGTDCSGFTKLVYANFGYTLNRTSSSQTANGTKVSATLASLQPGDLIFYSNGKSNGSIGHVALYIGNGKIVHASTPKSGIIVASAFYRTPYCAVRVIK